MSKTYRVVFAWFRVFSGQNPTLPRMSTRRHVVKMGAVKVEALRGDRSQPDAYASLAGKAWDIVIDAANSVLWTRQAVAALKGATGRFL